MRLTVTDSSLTGGPEVLAQLDLAQPETKAYAVEVVATTSHS
jgi:hypothetical protein